MIKQQARPMDKPEIFMNENSLLCLILRRAIMR